VQALKYEEDISGGVSGGSDVARAFSDGGGVKSARASSLSAFLIERASCNIELANFLYWYLKVEMSNPIYEARYREVFIAFQGKLTSVRVNVNSGSIIPPGQASMPESTLSLWNLLTEQDKFISGILRCQNESLIVRGKKDAKESHLREILAAGGFHNIPHAVPLPSAPHIWVKGVNCNSAKMFKSALYPAVLEFRVDNLAKSSDKKKVHKDERTLYKVMIKTGDDLRQDQLVIMMIQLMDRLLKRGTLDLW
jgi:phosphatidylinositol 3-kinase